MTTFKNHASISRLQAIAQTSDDAGTIQSGQVKVWFQHLANLHYHTGKHVLSAPL
jgi:hypothetical protein